MRNYFIILFCLIFNNLPGQNPSWTQLPDSNATWCAQRGFLVTGNPDAFHTYNYIQTIAGDTLINGLVYHKIYESGILDIMSIPPTTWTYTYYNNEYVGCIRENNNRQAFKIPSSSNVERLLYDFNLQIGDTVPSSPSIIVSGIDSIFDGFDFRLRFKLSSADTSFWPGFGYFEHVSWIEGIGSTGGNFFSLGPYFEHGGTLYEFTHDGIIYYQDSIASCGLTLNTDELANTVKAKIYPNPFQDKIEIDLDANISGEIHFEIFDLSGKKCSVLILKNKSNLFDLGQLRSGFYFYKLYSGDHCLKSGKLMKL
ncbi:MAG: T9SS type A sorting domain-containing protein [Bacteroidetes bacterium]|nr:T9SS type A sorting domain-containing protein [Bacteroidota bacterium]